MPDKRHRLSADVRREQILDAATELFIERGFADVKMGDIAERLHTSRPNIYTYFPSTDHILEVLLDRHANATITAFKEALTANPAMTAPEGLPLLLQQRELILLLHSGGGVPFKAHREKIFTFMTNFMHGVLDEQLRPEQRQAFESVMMLQNNLYLGTAYELLTQPGQYDTEAVGRQLQAMLEAGYARVMPQVYEDWKTMRSEA